MGLIIFTVLDSQRHVLTSYNVHIESGFIDRRHWLRDFILDRWLQLSRYLDSSLEDVLEEVEETWSGNELGYHLIILDLFVLV